MRNNNESLRKKEAIDELRSILKKGQVVFIALKAVSRSGMTRHISTYVVEDGDIRCLDYLISAALQLKRFKDGSLIIGGCGMDMGFHVVYSLSVTLFCPDKYKQSDAYALRHRWI